MSVIIPSYGADSNLLRAVDSVFLQTYPNIEIIVVDDNDPDSVYRKKTEEMVEELKKKGPIIYLKHDKNRNGSAARNTGLKASHGEYICFLDDDDEYLPTRIERCVSSLESNEMYDSVYSNVLMWMNGSITIKFKARYSGLCWKELLLDEGMLGTGSNLFFRKKAAAETGFFDEDFSRYQDVEYMLRFLQTHAIYPIDEYLVSKHLGIRNVPNYRKARENSALFFSKFDYLISELNPDEQTAFFASQFGKLLHLAIEQKSSRATISAAKKELRKYRKLTLIEKIGCVCPPAYIIARNGYHLWCKIRQKRGNVRL